MDEATSDLAPIPSPAMATTLHKDLRREVYRLFDALEAAAAHCPTSGDVIDAPEGSDVGQVLDALEQVRCYSRAVQVFAAMVVEATLNIYGLFRFGEEMFERKTRWVRMTEKVKFVLAWLPDACAPEIEAIVSIVDRLALRRNALVHPRAELYLVDDTGTFQPVTARRPGPVNLGAARAAVTDMERFLELFGALLEKHHVEAAVILHLSS